MNGDGVIDADNDRKVIGHALPKHTGGFSFNAGWKGFDLTAMFNWSYGNDILNMNKIPRISIGTSRPHIQDPRLLTSIFHIRVNKLTNTQKSSQPLSTFAL